MTKTDEGKPSQRVGGGVSPASVVFRFQSLPSRKSEHTYVLVGVSRDGCVKVYGLIEPEWHGVQF